MKKLYFLITLIGVMVAGAVSGSAEAMEVFKFTTNNEPEFLVSKINVSKNEIEIKYKDFDKSGEKINLINIVWGERGDEELERGIKRWEWLGRTRPFWATTGLYKYKQHWFVDEEVILLGDDRLENKLKDNKTGILYYALELEGLYRFWGGRVNYKSCVESIDYKEGVECRAEIKEDGSVVYAPYDEDGKRLRMVGEYEGEEEVVGSEGGSIMNGEEGDIGGGSDSVGVGTDTGADGEGVEGVNGVENGGMTEMISGGNGMDNSGAGRMVMLVSENNVIRRSNVAKSSDDITDAMWGNEGSERMAMAGTGRSGESDFNEKEMAVPISGGAKEEKGSLAVLLVAGLLVLIAGWRG